MKKIAMIMGGHPIDTIGIYPVLRKMEGIEIYPQPLDCFLYDFSGTNNQYDGYFFYCMPRTVPDPNEAFGDLPKKPRDTFYRLGEDGKGITIVHHGLVAFPGFKLWDEITGITDRNFSYFGDMDIDVNIIDNKSPITAGMSEWKLKDETFKYEGNLAPECEPVMGTTITDSAPVIAWTHMYKNSRVFCFNQGHDATPYKNENFVETLRRGILWSCGE